MNEQVNNLVTRLNGKTFSVSMKTKYGTVIIEFCTLLIDDNELIFKRDDAEVKLKINRIKRITDYDLIIRVELEGIDELNIHYIKDKSVKEG